MYRGAKKNYLKFGIFCVYIVCGIGALSILNFDLVGGQKAQSSYVRLAKIEAAWHTFMENPFLGIGYGAAAIADDVSSFPSIMNSENLDQFIDVKAGAEFTPSQILAETGLAGGLIALFLFWISFRRTTRLLKNPNKSEAIKICLLSVIVFYITGFVGGNLFNCIPFALAAPFIFDSIEFNRSTSARDNNKIDVTTKA
jgi:O-antigen ligase